MPKASPIQSNFNGGEFSPMLRGRVDLERYLTGLEKCLNYIPTIQGGLTRRPGTYFIAEVKDSTKTTRLQRFEYSTTQAYQIEVGDQYFRFLMDNAQITDLDLTITGVTQANPAVVTYTGTDPANGDEVAISGVVGMTQLNGRNFKIANVNSGANTFELVYMSGTNVNSTGFTAYSSGGLAQRIYTLTSSVPYLEAHVDDLDFNQSNDVMYITHPSYAPRKLTRTAHNAWTLTAISFLDGPYFDENTTATTLTASAASGAGVTLTASATTGINGGSGFQTTDVGRHIRIYVGGWSWLKITGRTSTTVVTVTVMGPNIDTAAHTRWQLGLWSDTTGYPAVSTFHEDRLCYTGCTAAPQRIDMSNSNGDYENFAPTDADGTTPDSRACSFNLNSNDVNVARWMVSQERALVVGTAGGEWPVRPSVQSEAISPSNVSAKQSTTYGSAPIKPVTVGKATIFVQRSKRKVREISYQYEADGFKAPNRTLLADHITGASGIKQMSLQKEPQSLVWCVREDGVVAALTYEQEDDALIVGWHRHILGGYSDAAENEAIVESVSTVPSTDGTRDEVSFIVRRRIDGRSVRYIEYMKKIFEEDDEQKDAFFVDCGLTYDEPITITGITAATPPVVTAASHGLSTGDFVLISDVEGMDDVNGNTYKVTVLTANTFSLQDEDGDNIDGSAFEAYVSAGETRKYVTTISQLWHLEGQTVDILADGAPQPSRTVSNGAITLQDRATTVHIGFGYNSDGKMMRLEAGSADGTAMGKLRRSHRVGFLVHRSLGLQFGTDFDNLIPITFETTATPASRAPELFTGVISELLDSNYDYENQICWRQSQPLPSNILAVFPQMHTEDAA